jgi:two-component system sensor histidine kinase/response regulator
MAAPLNILLVDDRAENLFALEEVLRAPDRVVYTAASGTDALRLSLRHEFAVVIMDVEMPVMDGYETAQLLRSRPSTRAVPIIFVTAGERTDDRAFRGYEVGAVDFLYKPIDVEILKCKVGVFADLHRKSEELKTLNDQLERSTSSLQEKVTDLEFVNRTLSHDLRAPLRSIHTFARVLGESLEGTLDAEQEDHLTRVLRSCERMERVLDDLFGLLRAGAAEAAFSEVDAGAVLDGVVENLRSDIEQTGAVVTHDELPAVRASPTLLAQVFQNLIGNAIKFRGDDTPEIHVGAERVGGDCIDPAHRDRVFGLFQRVGTRGPTGAGVGLALCKRAIEKQGGRIWVDSAPGAGSRFYFRLPAQ